MSRPSEPEPGGSPDGSASFSEQHPVLAPGHTYGSVTDKISSLVLVRPYNWRWFLGIGIGFALTMLLLVAVTYLLVKGVGIWGIDVPVMWGFAIVNFVWWIGIGHAGTLISAILFLFRQKWRTSINRFSEAMTIFAVICAGVYPGHCCPGGCGADGTHRPGCSFRRLHPGPLAGGRQRRLRRDAPRA